jgi:hypothetical protein
MSDASSVDSGTTNRSGLPTTVSRPSATGLISEAGSWREDDWEPW